ncbi:MAG: DNA primase, partial [Chloroflexi bacterium]|nr:DNA primase [Chloroflexota bacterium]
MPRIAAAELESLKKDIDLAALVRAKGVELKPHGKDLLGLCPFHDDKEPSLVVTPSKTLWHCLGACQTGGDVIQWVQQAEGISFRHAVELLRDGQASRIITSGKVANHSPISRLPAPVELTAD